MVVLYYKLVAFIPNTKDVWDFCLGGLKEEMEGIENSDPNQNNPFITAAVGIGGAAISIFSQIPNQLLMASSRWLRKVCKRRLEKTSSQRGKKF